MKHFKFGENWKNFSNLIDNNRLKEAVTSLKKLTNKKSLNNLSFLDIGCGSGLSSLAAIQLNCKKIYAIDQDEQSIKTTKKVLQKSRFKKVKVEKKDLFTLNEKEKFNIVYSWGVLHHTGNMLEAIKKSTKMVSKNGMLILALYKKTKLCNLWKIEKYIYKSSPKVIQNFIKNLFIFLFKLAMILKRNNFSNINLLVNKLSTYAADKNYIKTVRQVIKTNNFSIFDKKTISY